MIWSSPDEKKLGINRLKKLLTEWDIFLVNTTTILLDLIEKNKSNTWINPAIKTPQDKKVKKLDDK